jgi:hypothetical protein
MPYNCNICNKDFLSYSGFWKHNKKYHQSILNIIPQNTTIIPQNTTIIPQNTTNIKCKFCNKYLSRIDSLKRHEIKCKCKKEYDELENNEVNELQILKNEIEQLKLTLQKTLQIKKNIFNNKINNNSNNNTINNTINIVKFGTEDLQNIYTDKQMFNLINSGQTCIEKSIKYIHFNDKKPEYKNIFITNLKDKYAYVFDGDTFIIKEKDEVLDELLDNHAYNIKEFVEKNRDDLPDHTKRSMDRLLNFIYNKNNNDEYCNFDKYKLNNIKLLVYNLSNKNTNLININCN